MKGMANRQKRIVRAKEGFEKTRTLREKFAQQKVGQIKKAKKSFPADQRSSSGT
jgi:hypothetical protein